MDPPLHLPFFLLSSLLTHSLLLHLLLASASSPLLSSRKRKHPEQPLHPPIPTTPDHYPLLFSVSSSTFQYLAGLLDPLLDGPHSLSLPNPTVLALALARLSTGAPYPSLARRFSVPADLPRAATRRLRRVLLANFRFFLAFSPPPPSNLLCCGALACVRLPGPAGPLAVQIVSDDSSKFLNIAAGFRGERSDFEVLKLSCLYKDLEAGKLIGSTQYLVADGGGYPLLNWLMVPFGKGDAIPGSAEAEFNERIRLMCRPLRRAVRSLRRWGVIERLEEEEGARAAAACLGTCAMLHNVLLMREDYSALAPEEEQEEEEEVGLVEGFTVGAEEIEGRAVEKRNALVKSLLAGRCGGNDRVIIGSCFALLV